MDAFDFVDDESKKSRSNVGGLIWKLGTAYFLIGALCLGVFFLYTFIYPLNPLNPFPPVSGIASIPPATQTPLPTDTPVLPTNTSAPPTKAATLTPLPTATPFATGDVTPTQSTELNHFTNQDGTPLYLPHPDGCGGLYIAGNVVKLDGTPVYFMLVRVGGTLGGEPLQLEDALSSSNPNYSSSGWDVKIADAPIDSIGTVFVELYTLESNDPVSDLIIVDTYNDCNRNLIMVNFVQDE